MFEFSPCFNQNSVPVEFCFDENGLPVQELNFIAWMIHRYPQLFLKHAIALNGSESFQQDYNLLFEQYEQELMNEYTLERYAEEEYGKFCIESDAGDHWSF